MKAIKERFFRWLLGDRLAIRLRLYRPANISENNLVVYSYIYGIDDKEDSAV